MFCKRCGEKVQLFSRFCNKCGRKVSGESGAAGKKPRRGGLRTPSIIYAVCMVILFACAPFVENLPNGDTERGIVYGGIVFLTFAYFIVLLINIRTVFSYFKRFILYLIHHPVWGGVSLAVLAVIVLFVVVGSREANYKNSVEILPLLQDSLTEAAAAKLMGDSIAAGHPTPGASFAKVGTSAEAVAKRLGNLTVPDLLTDYKQAGLDWANKITVAAGNPGMWTPLSGEIADFRLALGESQAEELFAAAMKNIQALKEFGDTAAKKKDREAMRYIAAKLLVQEHWLKGVLYSENKILAFNFTPICLAASSGGLVEVPGVKGVQISCKQTCDWINEGKRSDTDRKMLWNMYRCDYCMKTAVGGGQQTQAQTEVKETGAAEEGAPFSYTNPKRKICLAGVWGQSGAYCAEEALSSVNEIKASAIELVEDKPDAQTAWVESWATLEPLETTEGVAAGEPVGTQASAPLPKVQAFYDACEAKGGMVGGANKVMARLPTTESGYTCQYKTDSANFGKDIPCWDLLTYSGGSYSGGNSGCAEKNLVPAAAMPAPAPTPAAPTQPPAKKLTPPSTSGQPSTPSVPKQAAKPTPKGGVWDGYYVLSGFCESRCEGSGICALADALAGQKSSLDSSRPASTGVQVENNIIIAGLSNERKISIDANGYARNDQDTSSDVRSYREIQFTITGDNVSAKMKSSMTGAGMDIICTYSGVRGEIPTDWQ